jgi:hypothetical protein
LIAELKHVLLYLHFAHFSQETMVQAKQAPDSPIIFHRSWQGRAKLDQSQEPISPETDANPSGFGRRSL